MNKTVAVITGGSSGIGKCTAISLRDRGCTVYELSRRDSDIGGIIHIKTDITDSDSVSSAISKIMEAENQIDILINNAGFGISGAVEFTSEEDAFKIFNVNFFGLVRVTKEVIPHMRKAGRGRIVNISSVAAVAPIPFQTFYSATKSAINTYTMALANEVSDFGIKVCAVMPGDISSGFTDARSKTDEGNDVYNGRITRSVSTMEKDEKNGMSCDVAGRIIANISLNKSKKPLYTIGIGYKVIVFLTKIFPSALLNKIIKILYAK